MAENAVNQTAEECAEARHNLIADKAVKKLMIALNERANKQSMCAGVDEPKMKRKRFEAPTDGSSSARFSEDRELRVTNPGSVAHCGIKPSLRLGRVGLGSSSKFVKGSMRNSKAFWEKLCPLSRQLRVIESGYSIPFMPGSFIPTFFKRNNRSALDKSEFVVTQLTELIASGAVRKVDNQPWVTSPLSVAHSGIKPRLILDLSWLNQFIDPPKFTLPTVAKVIPHLSLGGFMASFDFKSGYHHVDIAEECQTFLGFSWEWQGQKAYFVFTVLPFGLNAGPFIFTKLFRPLIGKWGAQGYQVFLYLDDGLIIAPTREACQEASDVVRADLAAAGVCEAQEKCVWTPT
jgi:hypothetical protein